MTKRQEQMLDNYNRARGITELYQVYGRFSKKKTDALERCRELQKRYDGYDGRICTASPYQFTYGFKYDDGYGHTCLCYCTSRNNYEFIVR